MQHTIPVNTPQAGWCLLSPQANSTKVQAAWLDTNADNPKDALATNLAAQWLLREGWVEFSAGTIDLNNELVRSLIEEIP